MRKGHEPSGHQVVVVDNLDEGANARTANNVLLRLSLEDSLGSTVDTSDQSVGVGTLLSSLVESLNDHSLLSSILAVEDDNNLTCLKATQQKRNPRGEQKSIESRALGCQMTEDRATTQYSSELLGFNKRGAQQAKTPTRH